MKIKNCRCCGENIAESMNFGYQPIANAFKKISNNDEYKFEMVTGFCEKCFTYQLLEQPDAEMMFHDSYAFTLDNLSLCKFILKNMQISYRKLFR